MKLTSLLVTSLIAFGAGAASAQTQSPQLSTSAPGDAGEVVTLSPFEVNSAGVHGYQASESVTGTRIATKISETPFAVDVVTQDFINDFMAFDLNSQLAFVPGFSPSEVFGSFQLRGFTSPVVFVDGFKRIGLVDTVDIARIEVIKGSAASIYGSIQPGGAVNIITLKPTLSPSEDLLIGAGSDSFYRVALFSSGPISNTKFYYRVDASAMYTTYGEDFASRKQDYLSAKLLYKPDDDTSVSIDVEHSELAEHPFNQVLTITEKQTMPWAGNNVTESQYYGNVWPSDLKNYDYAGPGSTDDNRVTSATVALEKRINDVWNLRFGANLFNNPYHDQLIGSGAYYPYGTGNVTVVNGAVTNAFTPEVKDQPQADIKPQKGGGAQLDDVFQWKNGPIGSRLLVTADYYQVTQRTITLAPTVNGSQATDYYALYSPYSSSGASYYTMQSTWNTALGYGWNTTLYSQDPALYNFPITDNWTQSQDAGLFASYWASLFHDRLTLMAGGRADRVRNDVANYNISSTGTVASAGNPTEPANFQAFTYNTEAKTYQLGASFKLPLGINIYANKSSAFNPQPQLDSYTGLPLPNNTSNGYEFGLKGSELDGRLTWSLDRFAINEFNVVQSETDPITGVKDTILSGEQQAKGYEAEFQYQINRNIQILTDWGYTPTDIQKSETITFLNGLPTRRVPRDNAGIAARYEFTSGKLRGLYVIGDVHYLSKSLINLGSGKSLIPGPAGATSGSTVSMYYVPSLNETFMKDPKATGEDKITATPVINVPFPGNGLLPIPTAAANALVNYPVDSNGNPLKVVSGSGTTAVYAGEPEGVFVDDGRELIYNPESAVVDLGFGYTWRMKRTTNALKVTFKNILNRSYTWGSGIPGMPFQIFATYDIHF